MALVEIAAVTSALGAIKTISEIAKNVNSIELTQKVIELQKSILDMQQSIGELREENTRLKGELAEAKRSADVGKDLTPDEGVYWKDGYPYCPTCWDVDRKPVRLSGPTFDGTSRAPKGWICSVHRARFSLNRTVGK